MDSGLINNANSFQSSRTLGYGIAETMRMEENWFLRRGISLRFTGPMSRRTAAETRNINGWNQLDILLED